MTKPQPQADKDRLLAEAVARIEQHRKEHPLTKNIYCRANPKPLTKEEKNKRNKERRKRQAAAGIDHNERRALSRWYAEKRKSA